MSAERLLRLDSSLTRRQVLRVVFAGASLSALAACGGSTDGTLPGEQSSRVPAEPTLAPAIPTIEATAPAAPATPGPTKAPEVIAQFAEIEYPEGFVEAQMQTVVIGEYIIIVGTHVNPDRINREAVEDPAGEVRDEVALRLVDNIVLEDVRQLITEVTEANNASGFEEINQKLVDRTNQILAAVASTDMTLGPEFRNEDPNNPYIRPNMEIKTATGDFVYSDGAAVLATTSVMGYNEDEINALIAKLPALKSFLESLGRGRERVATFAITEKDRFNASDEDLERVAKIVNALAGRDIWNEIHNSIPGQETSDGANQQEVEPTPESTVEVAEVDEIVEVYRFEAPITDSTGKQIATAIIGAYFDGEYLASNDIDPEELKSAIANQSLNAIPGKVAGIHGYLQSLARGVANRTGQAMRGELEGKVVHDILRNVQGASFHKDLDDDQGIKGVGKLPESISSLAESEVEFVREKDEWPIQNVARIEIAIVAPQDNVRNQIVQVLNKELPIDKDKPAEGNNGITYARYVREMERIAERVLLQALEYNGELPDTTIRALGDIGFVQPLDQ